MYDLQTVSCEFKFAQAHVPAHLHLCVQNCFPNVCLMCVCAMCATCDRNFARFWAKKSHFNPFLGNKDQN